MLRNLPAQFSLVATSGKRRSYIVDTPDTGYTDFRGSPQYLKSELIGNSTLYK